MACTRMIGQKPSEFFREIGTWSLIALIVQVTSLLYTLNLTADAHCATPVEMLFLQDAFARGTQA